MTIKSHRAGRTPGVLMVDYKKVVPDDTVTAAERDFLRQVVGLFTGAAPAMRMRVRAFPVGYAYLKDAVFMRRQVQEVGRFLSTAGDIFIADFTTRHNNTAIFTTGVAFLTCVQAIAAHLQRSSGTTRSVVLIPHSLQPRDPNWVEALARARGKRMVFISDSGECHGNVSLISGDKRGKYVSLVEAFREPRPSEIREKILRRIGHFHLRRPNGRRMATSVYYDCSASIPVIVAAIMNFVRGIQQGRPKRICVVSGNATWMSTLGATLKVEALRSAPGVAVEVIEQFDSQPAAGLGRRPVLVVLPLVDSGQTVRFLAAQLEGLGISNVVYLSILSTKGPKDGGVRLVPTDGGGSLYVHYLASVPPRKVDEEDERSTGRGLIRSTPLRLAEEEEALSSFAFWFMVKEVGEIRPETPVPPKRSSMGYLPDFSAVIKQNAPLLATKLLIAAGLPHAIGPSSGGRKTDIIIVCPAEEAAKGLAAAVRLMADYDVIEIPRKVLDHADGDTDADQKRLHDWCRDKFAKQPWMQKLNACHEVRRVELLLVDEFTFSGDTLIRLRRILSAFDLTPVGAAVFVQFSKTVHVSPTISLYDLHYHE